MDIKEKSSTEKTMENLADIIPFSMVSIVFFLTLITGLYSGLDLLSVMLRAIIGVVVFTVLGFFIRFGLKSMIKSSESKVVAEDIKSVIDIASSPDDSELFKEMRMSGDGFTESNPSDFTRV